MNHSSARIDYSKHKRKRNHIRTLNEFSLLDVYSYSYNITYFKGIRIPVLRDVIKMRRGKWMRLIYKLIQNSDWVSAENIYYDLKGWGETFRDSFDLKAVCNINLIHEHSWAIDYIMDLLKNGSDWRKLCIEKGESYLHAGVRIALATGNLKSKV